MGAVVRARRRELGLTQSDLAEKIAVNRRWLTDFESGKESAEIGLALRALFALGIDLNLGDELKRSTSTDAIDLKAHVRQFTKGGRLSGPAPLPAFLTASRGVHP